MDWVHALALLVPAANMLSSQPDTTSLVELACLASAALLCTSPCLIVITSSPSAVLHAWKTCRGIADILGVPILAMSEQAKQPAEP